MTKFSEINISNSISNNFLHFQFLVISLDFSKNDHIWRNERNDESEFDKSNFSAVPEPHFRVEFIKKCITESLQKCFTNDR